MIRVVVAEDQALIRESFARLIDTHPQMSVVAAVSNGAEAVRHAPNADVVVMDIRMPVLDGIEATRQIAHSAHRGGTSTKVLVLTTFREEALVLDALDAGAVGFLLKDSDPRELLSAILRIHRGEGVLDPKVTPMVLRHISPRGGVAANSANVTGIAGAANAAETAHAASHFGFTPREQEILALVCEGLSNDDIARRLVVATTTVKTHVKALLNKTNSRSRVDLVIWAARNGLL